MRKDRGKIRAEHVFFRDPSEWIFLERATHEFGITKHWFVNSAEGLSFWLAKCHNLIWKTDFLQPITMWIVSSLSALPVIALTCRRASQLLCFSWSWCWFLLCHRFLGHESGCFLKDAGIRRSYSRSTDKTYCAALGAAFLRFGVTGFRAEPSLWPITQKVLMVSSIYSFL